MRPFSIKSFASALVIALTITATTPVFAAARQNRERDRHWGPIERIVQVIKRLIGATPDDLIVPPQPAPDPTPNVNP
jgi:hypothetical protein